MIEFSFAEILDQWRKRRMNCVTTSHATVAMRHWFKCNHYKMLGEGMYGSAWKTPAGNVIKVNFSLQGAKDGWWLWATYAQDNPGNPYLPRVHSILRDGNYYIAHIEELSRVDEELQLPYRDECALIPDDENFKAMIDDLITLRVQYGNIYGRAKNRDEFLADMRNQFDLHRGNWLMRGDQLVLNDPINSLCRDLTETADILCAEAA